MARPWPAPLGGNTIHFVGDIHFGRTDSSYETATIRNGKMKTDLLGSRVMPSVDARVQVGDYTETAVTGEFTEATAWTNSIPGAWYGVTGNHDLWGVRDSASALNLTAWLKKTVTWTQDLGFVQLIGVSLFDWTPTLTLDQASLDYVDSQLAAATKDCVVVCHVPLTGTVLATDEALEYTTRSGGPDPGMQLTYEAGTTKTFPGIFNTRSRAKLYVSGHTHSLTDAPDLVKTHSLGFRSIVTMNCSAPVYTKRLPAPTSDEIQSLFVTFTGGNMEFRVRNHGAGVWSDIGGSKVVTKAVPA